MKKVQRFFALSLFLLLISSLFMTLNVSAASAEKQRVFDDANLLSTDEVTKLEKIAQKYSEKRETDFIIITQQEPEKDIEIYMDDFYDEKGLGFDKEHGNTAILGLDMTRRDVVISGFYKAEKYLDPDRIMQIIDEITPDLSAGNYYDAFELFIKTSDKYYNYKPGVNPKNPMYKTSVQFLIAAGLGVLIVGGMAMNTKPKMTTTANTYQDRNRSKVVGRRDRYIRTTVTKRRKPKQSNNSGGSGGGSFGRTSGGHSRSSGRGKF